MNTIIALLENHTTKRHITYTTQIKPKHIISKIIGIEMNILTIKHKMEIIISYKQHKNKELYLIVNMY